MTNIRKILMSASALAGALSIALTASAASAETKAITFDLPSQPLGESLRDFYRESGEQIVFSEDLVAGRTSRALKGSYTADQALAMLLEGTNLSARRTSTGVVMIEAPQPGSAAGDGADAGTVQALIVTAQKREENIQDVPIAISAFTQESLEQQKIEGGPDLMRGVPNLTFSKSNFTSYNISIRGIGTKAISATTDPGVAVSFNNVGLITNRFFEQEFFDLERLEVLRGPQGTLYGRNATGGVVNLITAKPDLNDFDGWIKGEVGNYHSKRVSAMVNVPLVEDKLAIRVAGALTDRQGYDYNSVTKNAINGRDLWSLRTTIAFEPAPWLRTHLIWERFREDDNRSRTGKQLCHRDDSPDMIGSTPTRETNPLPLFANTQEQRAALFSTGCKAGSLYDDGAFGTPNGLALPYVAGVNFVNSLVALGFDAAGNRIGLLNPAVDPYGGLMQSRNLREIASFRDPIYRAKSDILELNIDADLGSGLILSSQTAFNKDGVYSFQDYNRFNTLPVFSDTSALTRLKPTTNNPTGGGPSLWRNIARGGIFCDPQVGCSNTMGVFDISSSSSKQFSQEIRLQSDFSGPFNFSVGGNYTRFKTQNDYYVMSNLLTALAMMPPLNYSASQTTCSQTQFYDLASGGGNLPIENSFCPYIDPNPVESINGQGHNYFRSSNPYRLESWAVFGEAYYNLNPDLKITAGLRYTHDRKKFTLVPSQLLLAPSLSAGGVVGTGYPEVGDIRQSWGEVTGRLGVDWKPDLGFTDDTLVYAFYSRGYKAGGANPPLPGFATTQQVVDAGYVTQAYVDSAFGQLAFPQIELTGVDYGPTFDPEFVNAFEVGSKNVMIGGRVTLNASAFFYDYSNYQVSQIRDRTAVNENFDARIWGAELSALFEPIDRLRLNANIGYLDTRIGKGEKSIDIMNRTLGNPNYVTFKPWVQLPSNCVVPIHIAEAWLATNSGIQRSWQPCSGVGGVLGTLLGRDMIDPQTGQLYDPENYPEINGGAGFYTDLSGNELPNSPHWTMNIGAQYSIDFLEDWRMTVRGDAYWQSQSWARVYNLGTYDKLHGWYNANLSVWFERPDDDLKIELYVKNLLDDTPITDAFLNSDDTGLTTNVFVLDPRLIGLSIKKGF